MRLSFESKRQQVEQATKCYVQVAGTEFWIRISKASLLQLVRHLGSWNRLSIDDSEPTGAIYVSVDDF